MRCKRNIDRGELCVSRVRHGIALRETNAGPRVETQVRRRALEKERKRDRKNRCRVCIRSVHSNCRHVMSRQQRSL